MTHHPRIILKVKVNPVRPPPRLALPHNNCWHDLLPQLRLPLFDSRHNHVSHTSSRQSVQTRADTLDGDDVEISGTRVVTAVHHGAAGRVVSWVNLRLEGGRTYTGRPRVIFSLLPEA